MQGEDKANILVVDDNPAKRLGLVSVLEELNQNIVTAESGLDALRLLLSHEYAVILMDVQMPIMDGFETAALIRSREQSKTTPIIFVTAYARVETDMLQGYSQGAVDYVFTPIIPEILRAKVSVFVDLFQKTQAIKRHEEHLESLVAERTAVLLSVVENAPVRIFWKDRDLRFLGGNTRFAQDAGYSNPDELTGKTDFEMGWKDQAELYRGDDKAVMESGNPKLAYEEQQTTPDGNTIWLSTSKVPLRNASNQIIGILGIYQDITSRKRAESLLSGQKQVLEMIAAGAPLPETLTALVLLIEAQSPGVRGSILLLDEDGVHLRHRAAPNLPAEYNAAVDVLPIGPSAGSCGTSAYRKEAVFVEDIATDPLWANYKAVALPHGLRACWSTPIFDAQQRVLGTFAMYYRQPGLPQPEHLRLIDSATYLASIAISRQRADETLRASEEKFRSIIESSPVALAVNDEHQNITFLNRKFIETFGYTLADIQTLAQWWPRAFPDPAYRQRVAQEWQAAVEKAQRDRTEFEPMEYKVTGKDGTVRDIRFSMAPMGRSSLVILYDLTERKQAEQQVHEQLDELLRWQATMLGREQRVQQLKKEVNELLAAQHRPLRYTEPER